MRFAIFFVLAIFSIIIPLLFGKFMLESQSSRLWNQKTETIQSRCMMVAERIRSSGLQFTTMNEASETEIEQFASLMDGRIIVIDQNFRIVKDTFGIEDNR